MVQVIWRKKALVTELLCYPIGFPKNEDKVSCSTTFTSLLFAVHDIIHIASNNNKNFLIIILI